MHDPSALWPTSLTCQGRAYDSPDAGVCLVSGLVDTLVLGDLVGGVDETAREDVSNELVNCMIIRGSAGAIDRQ